MGVTSNFSIQSAGREISIKSIALDWNMLDTLTGVRIPWRTVTDQNLQLIIGNFGLSPQQIASPFRQTGGTPPAFNGSTFIITEPKQLFFRKFFVANELPFSLQLFNNNAANARDYSVSIIVETEEEISFG